MGEKENSTGGASAALRQLCLFAAGIVSVRCRLPGRTEAFPFATRGTGIAPDTFPIVVTPVLEPPSLHVGGRPRQG